MRKICLLLALCLLSSLGTYAWERETIWPKGKMPDAQSHQIAAMTDEANAKGFKADKHRIAYLEWFDAPAKETRTGGCMILISGGSYQNCCDMKYIEQWRKRFTELGFQCVNFVYRTPRPVGLPIWQTAWEDGQRAVRMVRSEAKKRGFDPEKIGVVSMSAGSHLALLLAANSQTPAYTPIDKLDAIPCHINWAVVNAPAYVTTDGETGTAATRQGYGKDVKLSSLFKFDEKTCTTAGWTCTVLTVLHSYTANCANETSPQNCICIQTSDTVPWAWSALWSSCVRWDSWENRSQRCCS